MTCSGHRQTHNRLHLHHSKCSGSFDHVVLQVPTKVAVSIKQVPTKLAYGIKALADEENEDRSQLVGDVFPKAESS